MTGIREGGLLFFLRTRKRRFEELMRPHLQALYRFAYRLCDNRPDAEDLVQDVMVKLYPRTDELAKIDQLRSWLSRVLYHQFVDRTRRQARQADMALSSMGEDADPLRFLDQFASALDGPEGGVERSRLQGRIQKALASLSPDQRVLLVLYDIEGWPQEEIAAVLDIPLGTVKSRLHRSRTALKQCLQRNLEPLSAAERLNG